MGRLAPRVLKISVSISRRELTHIIYLYLLQPFGSQIPERFTFKVKQGRQSEWDPASFEGQEDLGGHQCLQTTSTDGQGQLPSRLLAIIVIVHS